MIYEPLLLHLEKMTKTSESFDLSRFCDKVLQINKSIPSTVALT